MSNSVKSLPTMQTLLLFATFLLYFTPIHGVEVFVHIMPWFETKETNNGTWGIHWTMVNENPDNIIDGQPDLASFYHPQIGPYASSDPDVIDWQLGIIKAAGMTGVFIDWPGTTDAFDYAQNKRNAEAIIEGTIRAGLKFSVVYEDNNLNLAGVPDRIEQGRADMVYLQSNYFTKDNYYQVKGAPLVMDFGPQALYGEDWDQVLEPIEPGVTFVSLWNQDQQAGKYVQGEFAWVWADYVDSLITWYANRNASVKIGVAYPGFHPFYGIGGWPGPMYWIDYGVDTFTTTWEMALNNTEIIQICTWNDYGEGTIIEPTVEYGTTFVDIIQQSLESKYTHKDFEELTDIYFLRKKNAENSAVLEQLEQRHYSIVHKFD